MEKANTKAQAIDQLATKLLAVLETERDADYGLEYLPAQALILAFVRMMVPQDSLYYLGDLLRMLTSNTDVMPILENIEERP